METLDSKTAEIIPIDVLEKILYDQNEFIDFYYNRGNYANEDLSGYVSALNDLMAFTVERSDNVGEETFSRINAINTKYKYQKQYNYLEYQLQTTKLITIGMIEDILNYPATFNKFLDYASNSQYFGNIPLVEYLIAIFDYYNYSRNSNFTLSNEVKSKIDTIKKVFSLELKRAHALKATNAVVSLSPEMERKVLSKIDLSESRFAIARNLYVELNKICTYDIDFATNGQSLENIISKGIYEKDAANIPYDETTDKFPVICSTWSKCYYSLLKKLGFDATIDGNFHKYVVFNCDGTLIKADATNLFYGESDDLRLDDLTRCSLGLPTAGFICLENDKDISLAIEQTDREHDYIYKSKVELLHELADEYRTTYMEGKTRTTLNDRINDLERIVKTSKLDNLELMKYLNLIINPMFSEYGINLVKVKFVSIKAQDNRNLGGVIISYLNEDNQIEFISLDKENGIRRFSREELIEHLNNGNIVVIGKNRDIFGLESENNYGFNK